MKTKLSFLILLVTLFNTPTFAQKGKKSIALLDKDLSNFDIWMGVPHTTIEGLPENTYQSDKVTNGTPLGLNNDLKNVFSVIDENGEPVLKITGEIYGGLTSKETYGNYHLSVMFKWGDKKWEPRLEDKRDTGILYHCYGSHGSFWKTWKTSLEYQIQETDMGDFISITGGTATPKVGGPIVDIRGDAEKKQYNPTLDNYYEGKGYNNAYTEPDSPHGEWNHLEIYVVGNNAVHVVNEVVVMVVENAKKPDGTILDKGQLQIQSEAAECYYKQLVLTPIKKFPKYIKKEVRFK